MRMIYAYGTQAGRPVCEKDQLYNEMACEWDLQNPGEMILGLGNFNGHVGRRTDGFEGVHGRYRIGNRNFEGRKLLEFCSIKRNTWFEEEHRKITYGMGGNEAKVDSVLVGKNN